MILVERMYILNKGAFISMRAKDLKAGKMTHRNGYTVWYGQGRYYFSALYNSAIFGTLKEVKEHIKNL